MVITVVTVAVPQGVGAVYVMVTEPVAIPVTTPVPAPTAAMEGLLLLHTPPGVASVNAVVCPTHPGLTPAIGLAVAVITVAVAVAVHPDDNV
jgi:hypothetical protein